MAIVYDMKAQHNKLTILLLCSMHLLEDSDDDDDDVLNKTYTVCFARNSMPFWQSKHQHVQGIIDVPLRHFLKEVYALTKIHIF